MNKNLKIYAIICARGGSKGLRNKNIKIFQGKPLIVRSIIQAKKIKNIKKVIISTDSKKIASISKRYKAEVPFIRPKYLAKDNSPEWKVWQHLLLYLKKKNDLPDIIISLPTTSPLRIVSDIKNCLKKFLKNKKIDILITASKSRRNPYFNIIEYKKNRFVKVVKKKKKKIFNRQQVPETYDVCTLAYVTTPNYVLHNQNMFDGNVDFISIPKSRSIDIDDKLDFDFANYLYKRNNNVR